MSYTLNKIQYTQKEKKSGHAMKQKDFYWPIIGNSMVSSAIDLMHNEVTRLDAREECWS